mgnify:CR=1 FL=1
MQHTAVQLTLFDQNNYQTLTLSPSEVLAKISLLLDNARECKETGQALSLKQFDLLASADQEYLYGKTLKELSPQMVAKILRPSSKRLPTLGAIDLNGNCLIHRGYYPKTESASTLSDILENSQEIGEEYFLSSNQAEKISKWKSQEQPLRNVLQRGDKSTIQVCNYSENPTESIETSHQ